MANLKEVAEGYTNELPYPSPTASNEKANALESGDSTTTPQGLQRKLKARHVQMIAIGSNIGTGLFIGSGANIISTTLMTVLTTVGSMLHTGGPLALVIGFCLVAFVLTVMMQCLREMAVVLPTSGSFTRYATRFFDPSLGFAIGWQYWLAWVSVFGAESSAFVILINYWNMATSLTPLWISICLLINLAIHLCPVRIFGEVEFVVSTIKVIAVVAFIIVTWCIMAGAGPEGHQHGTEYWHLPGLENGLHNGFKGLASVFVLAAFAAGGVEMVGIVAGETAEPRWSLPRAIRTLMWRIVLFYIVSMIFLSFVVQYDNSSLVGGSNANSSPFVLAIRSAGIRVLPDILNAVVMICVCSVGSTSIYISSRTLQALAEDGMAFRVFRRTDRHGRPWTALLFTGAVATVLSYLNVSSTGSEVFGWFSAISGMAFFLAWLVIIACNWRFHLALRAQSDPLLHQRFAFRAPFHPWLSILAFAAILFMVLCQFIVSAFPISAQGNRASYFFSQFIGVPIFLGMWAGYKAIYWWSGHARVKRLEEVDLHTGRREVGVEEWRKLVEYESWGWGRRVLSYLRF